MTSPKRREKTCALGTKKGGTIEEEEGEKLTQFSNKGKKKGEKGGGGLLLWRGEGGKKKGGLTIIWKEEGKISPPFLEGDHRGRNPHNPLKKKRGRRGFFFFIWEG